MGTRLSLIALACCACSAPHAPTQAARPTVVVVISANAEWKALALTDPDGGTTPFGDYKRRAVGDRDVIFFHGGYAKVSAAGSTQYAIDRWHPELIVNVGTCGGFGGTRKVGDAILANKTIIYDILEQMGDPDEAIADYATTIDTSKWPARLRERVVVEPIVSADRDLVPAELEKLVAKYHASVGDWESGAIAWVAAKNHVPVLVLRGVTDVVDAKGDATYGNVEAWKRETAKMMAGLVALVLDALPDLTR
jgi:adenosylhomocysteine nucleosidase